MFNDERPTLDEVWHCVKCKWSGYPPCSIDYTPVPYGSTTAVMESVEGWWCPTCNTDENLEEGELEEEVCDDEG